MYIIPASFSVPILAGISLLFGSPLTLWKCLLLIIIAIPKKQFYIKITKSIAKLFDCTTVFINFCLVNNFFYDIIIARLDVMTLSCCFFVSFSSLCFATDEDGCAVENFCNTLFTCVYNLHEEIFCLIENYKRYQNGG